MEEFHSIMGNIRRRYHDAKKRIMDHVSMYDVWYVCLSVGEWVLCGGLLPDMVERGVECATEIASIAF